MVYDPNNPFMLNKTSTAWFEDKSVTSTPAVDLNTDIIKNGVSTATPNFMTNKTFETPKIETNPPVISWVEAPKFWMQQTTWTNINIEEPKPIELNPATWKPYDNMQNLDQQKLQESFDKEKQYLISDQEKKVEAERQKQSQDYADVEKLKWNYTNFDEISTKVKNVNDERIKSLQANNWVITDTEAQRIANLYWVTIDEVKDPKTILNKGILTQVWKDTLVWTDWKTTTQREQGIADLVTSNTRTKENYKFSPN